MANPPDQEIAELLKSAKTIAVVGISADRSRASNGIARYLQRTGFRVIPVNPNESEVLGEKCYSNLRDIPEPVDVVDVFRRPEFIPAIAADAIAINAKVLWMQQGIESDEAASMARNAGLIVIQDRCIMIDDMARQSVTPVRPG